MFEDDIDNDFDFDKEDKRVQNLPVYIKAREIFDMVMAIKDLYPADDETKAEEKEEKDYEAIMAQHSLEFMVGDAMLLMPKIAGAEGGDLYDIRMENAAIIRKAARDIWLHAGSIGRAQKGDKDYVKLLRDTIENEFKPAFAEWVASFDQWNYIIDRWGLFNPPGVKWDDKDPDEDIPWTNPLASDDDD